MKIKQTNISKYLQYAHTNLHSDYIPTVDKVKRTREKLNNVIQRDVKKHGGVLLTTFRDMGADFMTDKERIESIMNAIGVYRIPPPSEKRPHLWYREESNNWIYTGDMLVDDWYDYLGNPHIITTSGGMITVLLSDEGVEYMNRCALKVGFRPSPTYQLKKSEGEILDEEVEKLNGQLDAYFDKDETDWSIGYKLIQQFWDPTEKPDIVKSLWED